MPIIALLTSILPSLIGVAEKAFTKSSDPAVPPSGSLKKAFVMKSLEALYDGGIAKFMHDFPGVDEKRLFMRTADVWIDELVPSLTQ